MYLFAAPDEGNSPLFVAFVIIFLIGYLAFRGYVLFYRPDLAEAMHRRQLEREQTKAKERSERTGNIVGGIARALLGAALKNKPH